MPEENPTIDAVREELRRAIFWTIFQGTAPGYAGLAEAARDRVHVLLAFGRNASLITKEEADCWAAALREKHALSVPALLYMKDPHPEEPHDPAI